MGPGHFSAENNNLRVLNMNTVVCLHMKLCNLVLAGEKNGAKQKSQPAGPVFLSQSTLWSTQDYAHRLWWWG